MNTYTHAHGNTAYPHAGGLTGVCVCADSDCGVHTMDYGHAVSDPSEAFT